MSGATTQCLSIRSIGQTGTVAGIGVATIVTKCGKTITRPDHNAISLDLHKDIRYNIFMVSGTSGEVWINAFVVFN